MQEKWIPLSVPNLKGNELNYVTDAVKTEWVSTAGPYVARFEEEIAGYVQAKGAVSCQNGTAGLHTALLAAGVKAKDLVLVPALTFIAAVNPVTYVGAEPVFMDCDDSLCMDPKKVERYCETVCEFREDGLYEKDSHCRVKAMVVVHVFGNMADMESLCAIAKRYGIVLIEDATEALGTRYLSGQYAGKFAGTIGDIGIYSFNGNKIITTGGGGMLVSDREDYLARARHLTTQAKSDELYYTHDEVGYNYRMTNLQAALGLAQLEQLEGFIRIKERNYSYYASAFQGADMVKLLPFREKIRPNYWFYGVYCLDPDKNRDWLIRKLQDSRIQSRPVWGLIHQQPPYQGSRSFWIEKAWDYWEHVVNIPCSSNLSEKECARVAHAVLSM